MKQLLFLLFFLNTAAADPWAHLNRGDQTAQKFKDEMDRKKREAGPHPFYQGHSAAAGLRDSSIAGKSQSVARGNPAAQMIRESSDRRPKMKIDLDHDPLLKGSQKVQEDPLKAIGGKGTHVLVEQRSGRDAFLTCEEPGENSLETCVKELQVRIIKRTVKKAQDGTFEYGKCKKGEKEGHAQPCTALRNAAKRAGQALRGQRSPRGKPLDINKILDITNRYKACMTELKGKRYPCWQCHTKLPAFPFTVDQIKKVTFEKHPHAPKVLMNGETYHEYSSGRVEYSCQPVIKIVYEEETVEILPDEWISNCDRLEERVDQGICSYGSKECTQGRQTRVIEGVPITRDCWQETFTYSCEHPSKNDCGPLRARGCVQIDSRCKQMVGPACVAYTQTYQCKASTNTTHRIAGGDTPFCLDGNCRDQSFETNDEMMSSLAQLALLKELQGQFGKGGLFKGERNKCSRQILSFKDCCGKGKGWGKDLGLASCSADEKALNVKRKKGLCRFIGTYCHKKILGQCITKKSSYCCFGSKLLKAFHEQGRPQIGLGWGSPKEPLCRGFTIEEIQRIDFSKLDLREVFEDLMKNFNPQKMQGVGEKVKERMDVIKQSIVPGKKPPAQRSEG